MGSPTTTGRRSQPQKTCWRAPKCTPPNLPLCTWPLKAFCGSRPCAYRRAVGGAAPGKRTTWWPRRAISVSISAWTSAFVIALIITAVLVMASRKVPTSTPQSVVIKVGVVLFVYPPGSKVRGPHQHQAQLSRFRAQIWHRRHMESHRPTYSSPTSDSTPFPPPRRSENPQRDLPSAVVASLVACAVPYCARGLACSPAWSSMNDTVLMA